MVNKDVVKKTAYNKVNTKVNNLEKKIRDASTSTGARLDILKIVFSDFLLFYISRRTNLISM